MQARKTRKDERSRRSLVLVAGAVAALALVAAAAASFLLRDDPSESQDVAEVVREAGGTFRTYPSNPPGVHITNSDAKPKEWNSFPPTSGPHFGQWVTWGASEEPVPLTHAVHNLEHGGIVLWYGSRVPDDEVDALLRFYRDDPQGMLVAPLPELGDKIALTAWNTPDPTKQGQGVLAELTSFDEDAFEAFRDAYRFEGPERVPPDNMDPGE